MPLTKATGRVKVTAINAGKNCKYKLSELGIFQGTELEILSNVGALILMINNSRYILGRGMAEKIECEDI